MGEAAYHRIPALASLIQLARCRHRLPPHKLCTLAALPPPSIPSSRLKFFQRHFPQLAHNSFPNTCRCWRCHEVDKLCLILKIARQCAQLPRSVTSGSSHKLGCNCLTTVCCACLSFAAAASNMRSIPPAGHYLQQRFAHPQELRMLSYKTKAMQMFQAGLLCCTDDSMFGARPSLSDRCKTASEAFGTFPRFMSGRMAMPR